MSQQSAVCSQCGIVVQVHHVAEVCNRQACKGASPQQLAMCATSWGCCSCGCMLKCSVTELKGQIQTRPLPRLVTTVGRGLPRIALT